MCKKHKNWLFAGLDIPAQRTATLYSVTHAAPVVVSISVVSSALLLSRVCSKSVVPLIGQTYSSL